MSPLDRRQLLIGSAGTLLGTAALPLGTAGMASAAGMMQQVTFSSFPGLPGEFVTGGNYGGGRLGVTWAKIGSGGRPEIIEQWRVDYNGGVKMYSRVPSRGRVLQLRPIDPAVGIFGATTPYESFRIDVNGFGIVNVRAATERVRIQVMGSNGRHYYGDFARYGNPGPLQDELNSFLNQVNTLNQQWGTYRNAVRASGGTTAFSVATGIALIAAGHAPAVIMAFIGAVATGGVSVLLAIRNNLLAVQTTYNNLIDTFGRIEHAFGTTPSHIPRYDVGNARWNGTAFSTSTAAFPLISTP